MIYYEQSISRDSERKGGCFVNEYIQALPGILFWVVLFVVIKSVRAKRDEESKHPKNAAQRELVDDVSKRFVWWTYCFSVPMWRTI